MLMITLLKLFYNPLWYNTLLRSSTALLQYPTDCLTSFWFPSFKSTAFAPELNVPMITFPFSVTETAAPPSAFLKYWV